MRPFDTSVFAYSFAGHSGRAGWAQFLQPLLISSYAVLFTYLSAIGEVSFIEFLITYLFVLFFSFSLIICFKFIYKSFNKAFFFTSIFLLFFWNVTPISRTFYNLNLFGIQIFRLRYLIPITFVFLFVLFIRLFKSKKQTYFLSTFFFYPYLVLNLFCVFNIVKEKIEINKLIEEYVSRPFDTIFCANHSGRAGCEACSYRSSRVPGEAFSEDGCIEGCGGSKITQGDQFSGPDIYYILLDTYLSQDALKQNFNFDNKEFLNSLQKKGFQILNNSYSNYPETVSSLSATLNMNYHEKVKSEDQQQFFGLGFYKNRNNFVSKFLKTQGYKIINIPSVWGDMPKNNYANIDYYSPWPKRFFANLLERMTIISPFVYLYIGHNSRNVFFEQLKIIEKHIKEASPKFIFAHILMPHSPFVFDEKGENTNPADWLNDSKLYLGQLKFINKKIKELVDRILKQSNKPPIIILQADHGLNAGIMFSDYSKINEVDKSKLIKSFGVLNAVYYPEGPFETPCGLLRENGERGAQNCSKTVQQNLKSKNKLYRNDMDRVDGALHVFSPSVLPEEPAGRLEGLKERRVKSPINNFKFIFNKYFGTNFKLLKDETFVGPWKDGEFIEVENLRDK